jgi:glycosyltransferase involved in cell wall biosynthesis
MNTLAFVICTKESKYIYECLDRIKKYYGNSADIIIVDSCSTDKKYFELKDKYSNVFIEDICNKNYEYGSIMHGFKKYNDYETYVFIQDGIYIEEEISCIKEIKNDEVYLFGTPAINTGWDSDLPARDKFYKKHKNFPVPYLKSFMIAEWNSFAINKQTFNKVINSNIFLEISPPDEKIFSCAWERVWGIIFIENKLKMESLYKKAKYSKTFGRRM